MLITNQHLTGRQWGATGTHSTVKVRGWGSTATGLCCPQTHPCAPIKSWPKDGTEQHWLGLPGCRDKPHMLLFHHTQEGLSRTCHLCVFARNTVAVVLFSHEECKDICHRHGKRTLVRLKVLNPVSLQEKAEYKLTKVYWGSKQQELPS